MQQGIEVVIYQHSFYLLYNRKSVTTSKVKKLLKTSNDKQKIMSVHIKQDIVQRLSFSESVVLYQISGLSYSVNL